MICGLVVMRIYLDCPVRREHEHVLTSSPNYVRPRDLKLDVFKSGTYSEKKAYGENRVKGLKDFMNTRLELAEELCSPILSSWIRHL
jgi:hypothetical protein